MIDSSASQTCSRAINKTKRQALVWHTNYTWFTQQTLCVGRDRFSNSNFLVLSFQNLKTCLLDNGAPVFHLRKHGILNPNEQLVTSVSYTAYTVGGFASYVAHYFISVWSWLILYWHRIFLWFSTLSSSGLKTSFSVAYALARETRNPWRTVILVCCCFGLE